MRLSVFLCSVLAAATPPACFLSCINENAVHCARKHSDLRCLCQRHDPLIGCLVDICPYGAFDSARDHFVGTCMEHGVPARTEPVERQLQWPGALSPALAANVVASTMQLADPDGPVTAGDSSEFLSQDLDTETNGPTPELARDPVNKRTRPGHAARVY